MIADELFETIAKNNSVEAVIVSINSTGGVTAGGEALYESLRRLSDKKPTVATLGTVGASAAYMAAIATDHVVARRTTITGSIGVIFSYPEVSELMKTIGIEVEEVRSAPLKAEPSPFNPPSPEATAVVAGVVRDTYEWFVDIVAERRELDRPDALKLSDGRIFTGRQALDAKLIDQIGGEEEAVAWLAEERGVDADLPVKDWKVQRPIGESFSYSDVFTVWLAQKFGVSPQLLPGNMLDFFLPQRVKLDGLISVWQGPIGGRAVPADGAP